MRDVTTDAEIYFLEVTGDAATRIGRTMISPNMPPEQFTEAEYKRHRRVIDFYVDKGVLLVTPPGSRDAIMKAAEIEKREARQIHADIVYTEVNDDKFEKEILKQKGSNYRVADIELGMGIPPTVTFGVRRVKEASDAIINKP